MGIIKKIINKINYLFAKKKRTSFYRKFIDKDDLVFDVGANNGDRVNIFVELDAKVIAIEPNPKLAKKLNKKYGKKVKVIQKAIGETNEYVELYINDADVLSTTSKDFIQKTKDTGRFGELSNKFNETIKVEMILLDTLFNKYGYPTFIKIDTEGLEYQILKTLRNNKVNALSFEFATPEVLNDLLLSIEHLNNIGYKNFNIIFGESMEFLSAINMDAVQIKNLIQCLPDMCWGDIYAFNK